MNDDIYDLLPDDPELLLRELEKTNTTIQQKLRVRSKLENRKRYFTEKAQREEKHRFESKGRIIETVCPDLINIPEAEFCILSENIFELPEVKRLVFDSSRRFEEEILDGSHVH